MSRVTIGELTEDYLPFTKEGNEATTIEVVPRKMVEMIIEKCKLDHVQFEDDKGFTAAGVRAEAEQIKKYAEGLLRDFEKEPRARVCSNCSHAGCVSPLEQLFACPYCFGYSVGEKPACEHFEER